MRNNFITAAGFGLAFGLVSLPASADTMAMTLTTDKGSVTVTNDDFEGTVTQTFTTEQSTTKPWPYPGPEAGYWDNPLPVTVIGLVKDFFTTSPRGDTAAGLYFEHTCDVPHRLRAADSGRCSIDIEATGSVTPGAWFAPRVPDVHVYVITHVMPGGSMEVEMTFSNGVARTYMPGNGRDFESFRVPGDAVLDYTVRSTTSRYGDSWAGYEIRVVQVPEPSTTALGLIGLAGLAAYQRRRKSITAAA